MQTTATSHSAGVAEEWALRHPAPPLPVEVEEEDLFGAADGGGDEVAVSDAVKAPAGLGVGELEVELVGHPLQLHPRPAAALQPPHPDTPRHVQLTLLHRRHQHQPPTALHQARRPEKPPHRSLNLTPRVGSDLIRKNTKRAIIHAVETPIDEHHPPGFEAAEPWERRIRPPDGEEPASVCVEALRREILHCERRNQVISGEKSVDGGRPDPQPDRRVEPRPRSRRELGGGPRHGVVEDKRLRTRFVRHPTD